MYHELAKNDEISANATLVVLNLYPIFEVSL